MKVTSNVKHPILNSVLWTICILLFYSAGGAIAQITKQDKVGQLLIQGIAVWASVITVFIYLRVKHQSPKELDFSTPAKGHLKKLYYYIPILLIEITGFIVGLRKISVSYCLAALFLLVAVGFSEEMYFRGLIFKGLLSFGTKKAILISSIFFGLGHLANCFGGQNVFLTILQVFWAFTFGIVFAEIYLLSKSIYPIVILHFLHDFFGYIQTEIVNSFSITLYACHVVILVIYCILLWKKLFQSEEVANKNVISA